MIKVKNSIVVIVVMAILLQVVLPMVANVVYAEDGTNIIEAVEEVPKEPGESDESEDEVSEDSKPVTEPEDEDSEDLKLETDPMGNDSDNVEAKNDDFEETNQDTDPENQDSKETGDEAISGETTPPIEPTNPEEPLNPEKINPTEPTDENDQNLQLNLQGMLTLQEGLMGILSGDTKDLGNIFTFKMLKLGNKDTGVDIDSDDIIDISDGTQIYLEYD